MVTLPATKVREEFSETLSRVAYGKERIILERHGKEVVAIIPVRDLRKLELLEKDHIREKKMEI